MMEPAFVHDQGGPAWIVAVGYAVGAVLAYVAATRAASRERIFWCALSITMILLGFNRQLNLLNDLTEMARATALSEGWYGRRSHAQGLFILFVALFASGCGLLLWAWLRGAAGSVRMAAAALIVLLAFVLIRAASFHDIDYWVTINVAGLRSGRWLELLAIAIIAFSAILYRRRPARPEPANPVGP